MWPRQCNSVREAMQTKNVPNSGKTPKERGISTKNQKVQISKLLFNVISIHYPFGYIASEEKKSGLIDDMTLV